MESIYEEVAAGMTRRQFETVFTQATREHNHDFLFLDMLSKVPEFKIRKNFNEAILIEEEDLVM
jgi:hypothetical protein